MGHSLQQWKKEKNQGAKKESKEAKQKEEKIGMTKESKGTRKEVRRRTR